MGRASMLKELEMIVQTKRRLEKEAFQRLQADVKDQILSFFKIYIYSKLSRHFPIPCPEGWSEIREMKPPIVLKYGGRHIEILFKVRIDDLELYCGYVSPHSPEEINAITIKWGVLESHRPAVFVRGECPYCKHVFTEVNLDDIEDLYDKVTQAMHFPPRMARKVVFSVRGEPAWPINCPRAS
jgi:hypothetical protein